MKRYRNWLLAMALGSIALAPTVGQAATPLDLEFQSQRLDYSQDLLEQAKPSHLEHFDVLGQSLRQKLIYSE